MLMYLRHGQTDANLNKMNAGGEWDIDLNATGEEQARRFGLENFDLLRTITHLYVSPMRRARRTAELALGDLIGGMQMEIVEDLREWHLGEWTRTYHHETPDYFDLQLTPPGGESFAAFESRCLKALKKLAARADEKALIVAHGGVWYTYARHTVPENCWIENCRKVDICRRTAQTLAYEDQGP